MWIAYSAVPTATVARRSNEYRQRIPHYAPNNSPSVLSRPVYLPTCRRTDLAGLGCPSGCGIRSRVRSGSSMRRTTANGPVQLVPRVPPRRSISVMARCGVCVSNCRGRRQVSCRPPREGSRLRRQQPVQPMLLNDTRANGPRWGRVSERPFAVPDFIP